MKPMGPCFRVLGIALFGAGALGTGALGVSGCGDSTPATPQAFIAAQLGPGPSNGPASPAACQLVTIPWLQIGTDDTQPGTADGTSQNGATVKVSCSVVQKDPHTYVLNLSAAVGGQGSLQVSNATVTDDVTALQPNISAAFQSGVNGDFGENDCTIDFNGQQLGGNEATNPNMGVAPGRIWGNILCPKAAYPQQNKTCQGTSEFKFENCSQ